MEHNSDLVPISHPFDELYLAISQHADSTVALVPKRGAWPTDSRFLKSTDGSKPT